MLPGARRRRKARGYCCKRRRGLGLGAVGASRTPPQRKGSQWYARFQPNGDNAGAPWRRRSAR
eukprot:364824-Chlamydomonas_euryale.AAC.6